MGQPGARALEALVAQQHAQQRQHALAGAAHGTRQRRPQLRGIVVCAKIALRREGPRRVGGLGAELPPHQPGGLASGSVAAVLQGEGHAVAQLLGWGVQGGQQQLGRRRASPPAGLHDQQALRGALPRLRKGCAQGGHSLRTAARQCVHGRAAQGRARERGHHLRPQLGHAGGGHGGQRCAPHRHVGVSQQRAQQRGRPRLRQLAQGAGNERALVRQRRGGPRPQPGLHGLLRAGVRKGGDCAEL